MVLSLKTWKSRSLPALKYYENYENNEYSKIFNNEDFGYTKICIEQPQYENNKIKKDKLGNIKPDPKLRDTERVPLNENINSYFLREIKPHLHNSWVDRSKDQIGYEILFNKYFYKFKSYRSNQNILSDLKKLDLEINKLNKEIFEI